MFPASKRSSRSNVMLQLGPMTLNVDVFSGTYTPPSAKTYCKGTEAAGHESHELTSKRYCPVCSKDGELIVGEVIRSAASDSGALMPVGAAAVAERLLNVEPLRDTMELRAVEPGVFAERFVESANIYWLTPSEGTLPANYLGLIRAIEERALVLLTVWASRTVAKPYRVGVHGGMLTLTELVPGTTLRAAPSDPPEADEKAVQKAAGYFALAADDLASVEEVEQLAIDPGREALRRAANAAEAAGEETLKVERGERRTFAATAAEADLEALLEAEILG